jgi:hypothetical protein
MSIKRPPVLTPHGSFLYRLLRDKTGMELTLFDFLDQVLCGGPHAYLRQDCLCCNERKRLIGGTYCVACVAGALQQ